MKQSTIEELNAINRRFYETTAVEFDQTPAVASALKNLVNEGALGAVLTGLMVLLFLRDGRSALVVLAILAWAIRPSLFTPR